MTAYKNFIQDFPTRCCEILKDYEREALSSGREVTLTLAMAASGLVVPFERLRDQEEPPYQDRSNYPEAVSQFERLLEEKFLGSRLWEKEVNSWAFGKLEKVTGDPDGWPELQAPKALSPDKKVGSTLKHLRNALAHG